MLVPILFSVIVVEGILILKWKVSCTAMIYHMTKKGYTLPNDEEMKECTLYAARKMIKLT